MLWILKWPQGSREPQQDTMAHTYVVYTTGVKVTDKVQDNMKYTTAGSYVALTLLGRAAGQQNQRSTEPPPVPPHAPGTPLAQLDSSPVRPVLDRSESTRISGPVAVDAGKDKELRGQKIATIRLMYEQVSEEVEKIRMELEKKPHDQVHHLQRQLDEKAKLVDKLGEELHSLTGIAAESSHAGPRSPPSGLPPPGGTFSSSGGHMRPPLKRYGSGEHLNQIQEGKENHQNPTGLPPTPHPQAVPAPWLLGGAKHRKADSMPEPLLEDDDIVNRDITVARSHSDGSRKKKKVPTATLR